jgi:hypothetical protein
MIALASLLAAAHAVVFRQEGSIASSDFAAKTLPRLRELAASRGIALDLRDVRAGAPGEVHATPLVVCQDSSGRCFCRGQSDSRAVRTMPTSFNGAYLSAAS